MTESYPPPPQPPGPPPQGGPPAYGAPPQGYYPQPQYGVMAPPSNGMGTAAGVVGIIAIILIFIPYVDFLGVLLGLLAIIFGAVGIGRANRMGGHGKGMAVTGLVLGIISVALFVLLLIVVFGAIYSIHTTTVG
jgi:hypothetical protein